MKIFDRRSIFRWVDIVEVVIFIIFFTFVMFHISRVQHTQQSPFWCCVLFCAIYVLVAFLHFAYCSYYSIALYSFILSSNIAIVERSSFTIKWVSKCSKVWPCIKNVELSCKISILIFFCFFFVDFDYQQGYYLLLLPLSWLYIFFFASLFHFSLIFLRHSSDFIK